ncbi:MAG: hypothetical protein JSR77_05460 [Planctomycetes bacterium]|nr:hypothetical protein [Planctomycetota bacterium]
MPTLRFADRCRVMMGLVTAIGFWSPTIASAFPSRSSEVCTLSDDPLTAGVESIASAGIPGPLAVLGTHGRALIGGREDSKQLLPVAVAAEWDKGRVVAVGHGGMIAADALKHPGTCRFVQNSARWLAGAEKAKAGVLNNAAMIGALSDAGFDAQPLQGAWQDALSNYSFIVVDSHSIGEKERPAISQYIRNGGGLLTAGLGWGWLQLHPGKTIHDHPGNLLLSDCGIAWCDGTLDPTDNGAFKVIPLSPQLCAPAAMDALEAAANAKAALEPQAGVTLTAALRVIAPNHPLFQRALTLLSARQDSLFVSKDKPLRRTDGVSRVLLALQVELERQTPADRVRAHPASAAFPGQVPADAARVDQTIELDMSVPQWHSTGLYAPPGAVVTVTNRDEAKGCSLRIGCHTDTLWHHERWDRVPDVSREWPLTQSVTTAASAFGGLVYIEVSSGRSGTAHFLVSGAVQAPRYVLGKTASAEWVSSRQAPGPWGELESGKVIVSVPSQVLRELEDPSAVMEFWNKISDAHATLATIATQPDRPHRFVADVQISAGYMHSGYPIMTHLDAANDMVSVERLRKGTWGLLHELGHNHQQADWTFEGTGEVTCNLFALHAIDTICSPKPGDRGHEAVNKPPKLGEYLSAGAKFDAWKRDPFLALHMYVQLQRAFGWETFERVFAEYRALPKKDHPKNDADKRDQWMARFSRACGKNLGPFFQAWGVPTSEAARQSIAGLPEWMPEDWPVK